MPPGAARRWLLALPLGAGVAVAVRRRGALSNSGAAGAAAVGAAVYGAGGVPKAVLLLLFFGSSTLLSRLTDCGSGAAPRGPRRSLVQVLANGGLPALLALYAAGRQSSRADAAYAGALAAANADTWATEIGALSRAAPRLIISGRTASAGQSGAVTPLGLLASVAGALLLGGAYAAFIRARASTAWRIAAAGVAGSVADSVLGATLQAAYTCRECGAYTENRRHAHDGRAPQLTRLHGLPLMTNDMVNLCASLTGAVMGAWAMATDRPEGERVAAKDVS